MNKATLIVGRFQPFHNGHVKIAEKARAIGNEVIIGLIRRDTLSKDNPFPHQFTAASILNRCPWVKIAYFKNGNLAECKELVRKELGLKVTRLLCGPDRFASYDLQAKKYDLDIDVLKVPEIYNIRGTAIRDAIKNNDTESFVRMMGSKRPMSAFKKYIK